jgi:aromatic ring-cleaving dioxygenase
VSQVLREIRNRGGTPGGILGYPLGWVYQEVATLSMRVHWTYEDVLNLDHADRRRWIEEILKLERG